nr:MAG TPA: hypothetical protein [Caudoviricetes sp.]
MPATVLRSSFEKILISAISFISLTQQFLHLIELPDRAALAPRQPGQLNRVAHLEQAVKDAAVPNIGALLHVVERQVRGKDDGTLTTVAVVDDLVHLLKGKIGAALCTEIVYDEQFGTAGKIEAVAVEVEGAFEDVRERGHHYGVQLCHQLIGNGCRDIRLPGPNIAVKHYALPGGLEVIELGNIPGGDFQCPRIAIGLLTAFKRDVLGFGIYQAKAAEPFNFTLAAVQLHLPFELFLLFQRADAPFWHDTLYRLAGSIEGREVDLKLHSVTAQGTFFQFRHELPPICVWVVACGGRDRWLGVFQVVSERRSVGQERLRVLDELLVGFVLLNAHSVSYGGLKQLVLSPAIVDTRTIFLVRFQFTDLPWVGIPEFLKAFRVGCLGNDFCWNSRFIKRNRGRSFLAGAFFALSLCVPSLPLDILIPLCLPFSPVVKTDTAIFNIEPAGIFHRTNDSFG